LKREGDVFIAFSGIDGVTWTEFARITQAMPATAYFGLAVTAHTASATTTAKFWLQNSRFQAWYYPSRTDCVTCHTTASGGVLGLKTRQLNKDQLYPNAVTDNQLRAWNHVGLFNNGPLESDIAGFDKLAALTDASASLEKRARSYFDANCAQCHRPGGVPAYWDARYDTPLPQQGILYGAVASTIGIPNGKVVVPQDLARSILYQRVNRVGENQMPPLARNQIDHAGVDLLAAWIASLTPNSPPLVALTSPLVGRTSSARSACRCARLRPIRMALRRSNTSTASRRSAKPRMRLLKCSGQTCPKVICRSRRWRRMVTATRTLRAPRRFTLRIRRSLFKRSSTSNSTARPCRRATSRMVARSTPRAATATLTAGISTARAALAIATS
jgi:mono/diheme cytochrome c family protein